MGVQLSIDHLRRWVGHSDPILLCLYHKQDDRLFIINPKAKFSLWQLTPTSKKYFTIRVGQNDIFDNAALRNLIWSIRVAYYSTMVSRLESRYLYSSMTKSETKKRNEFLHKEIGIIMFDFLRVIEVLRDGKLEKKFFQYVSNASKNFSKERPKDKDLGLRAAFMLALLGRVNEITSGGLPQNLMELGTDFCGDLMRFSDTKKWQELSDLFPEKWHPFGIKRLPRQKQRK